MTDGRLDGAQFGAMINIAAVNTFEPASWACSYVSLGCRFGSAILSHGPVHLQLPYTLLFAGAPHPRQHSVVSDSLWTSPKHPCIEVSDGTKISVSQPIVPQKHLPNSACITPLSLALSPCFLG